VLLYFIKCIFRRWENVRAGIKSESFIATSDIWLNKGISEEEETPYKKALLKPL
jgi:hypothetical protein